MLDDRIDNLLKDVDAGVGAPRLPGGLAERVRATAKKRVARRRYVAGVAIVLLLASVMTVVLDQDKKPVVDVAAARLEIAQLGDEAKLRSELADRLWERERERQKNARRRVIITADPIEVPIERAAYAMVFQADRMARNPALRDAAIEAYREVSSDFPKSPSAQVARQRLETMVERKDG